MKQTVKEQASGIWRAMKIFIVFALAILASASLMTSALAENETLSTIDTPLENISLNTTDGQAALEENVNVDFTLNTTLENVTVEDLLSQTNHTNDTESVQELPREFIFNVVIEEAEYVDIESVIRVPTNISLNETLVNSTFENATNSSSDDITFVQEVRYEPKLELRGYIDTYLATNKSMDIVYSAVELDIYSDVYGENSSVMTGMDICYYYVNGTNEFICHVGVADDYTVVGITDFENQTYYRYASFNSTVIEEELSSNISIDIDGQQNSTDDLTLGDLVSEEYIGLNVTFKEAYEGRFITGIAALNITEINSTLEVAIWNIEAPNKTTVCEYVFNDTVQFACAIENPKTGLYGVNVTARTSSEVLSVYELTYLEAPELKLRILSEGTYNLDDIVNIRSYATYDSELIDTSIDLRIILPSGSELSVTNNYPFVEFYADELGYYQIIASTIYGGQTQNMTVGLVVGIDGKVGFEENTTEDIIENEPAEVNDSVEVVLDVPEKSRSINLSNVTLEIESIYEIDSEVLVAIGLENISINSAEEVNASITFKDPENGSVTFIAEFIENISEILYLPIESGNYSIELEVETANSLSTVINKTFRALGKTDFAIEKFIDPASKLQNISGAQIVELDTLIYNETEDAFDAIFNISNSSRVSIKGIRDFDSLKYVQSIRTNESKIATEVFAIDDINLTSAEITLEKTSSQEITKILHCEIWNETTLGCENDAWSKIDIPFVQNETHVVFNVTHFTAYAGGLGNNSVMSIWDVSDIDKDNLVSYTDTLVNFTANYTDNLTGVPIENAVCNITLDSSVYSMDYASTPGTYWYNSTIATKGLQEYTINCSNVSYDPLSATDNITIYSKSNVTSGYALDSDITLEYSTELVCSISDAFSASPLDEYNVSFYSSESGYIGSSLTNTSGIANVSYTPTSLGTHTITCNITDNETGLYHASLDNFEQFDVDVHLSRLRTTKELVYNSSGTYNVTLTVENYGLGKLYNVTVGDFVSDQFIASFINESDWSVESINIRGNTGSIYYWNISQIAAGETIVLDYLISNNSAQHMYDISYSYILGQTYYLK